MKKLSFRTTLFCLMFCCLVFVLLSFFGGSSAYAISTGTPITEEALKETFIPKWIDSWYGDETILKELIPIYGDKENLIGYEADFEKDGLPNGYFILNLRKDIGSAFPEFALDGDGIFFATTRQSSIRFISNNSGKQKIVSRKCNGIWDRSY